MNVKAVELVRKIRDRHYRVLKGKSLKEQRAFYLEKAAALEQRGQLLRCPQASYGRARQRTPAQPPREHAHG